MKLSSQVLAVSLVFAACSKGGGGGSDGPKPPVPGAPGTPENPADPEMGTGEDGEKPLEPLAASSLEELVAKVAPDFKPEAATEDQISDMLEKVGETFDSDGTSHFEYPNQVTTSEEDDPDLEAGGTCKAIYSGFLMWDFDWWTLDANHVRNVIRYGVKATDTEDLKREVITERPAYSTVSYKETNKSEFFDYTSLETVHLAKSGDLVLMATEEIHQPDAEDDGTSASLERCARLLDFKTKTVTKACSSASYGMERNMRRVERSTKETLAAGQYSKSDSESTTSSGTTVSWSTEFKQTGADTETFVQDFRSYYTSADAGWLFGAFFPPYGYAAGDVKFKFKAEDATDVEDCTVSSVKFAP